MGYSNLLSPFNSKGLNLNNHIVMAPLTRCRAIGNTANEMIAKYYAIRAEAGLLIAEGTAPSKNGLGYPNIPGIYSKEQIDSWKKVTKAVHENGGKIFLQILHVGRIAHKLNIPEGGEIIAPSVVQAKGDMFTFEGPKPFGLPREMTLKDIEQAQNEFVQASKNAIEAGFDGIEIHAANGYLPNQFINPITNIRNDEYGSTIENRCKFAIEIAQKIANAIGSEKTGIRLSPYGVYNDMAIYESISETYSYLIQQLNPLNLAYIHLVNISEEVPEGYLESLAKEYEGTVIFNGGLGYDLPRAEKLVSQSNKHLVSIGVPFISNPDLVKRITLGAPFNAPDQETFYTPGKEGYLTYPTLEESKV